MTRTRTVGTFLTFVIFMTLGILVTTAQAQLLIRTADLSFDRTLGVSTITDSNEAGDALIVGTAARTVVVKANLSRFTLWCPGTPGPAGTIGLGINARGTIVGFCRRHGHDEGFLRTAAGSYVRLHRPGAIQSDAISITDSPEIVVGSFRDATGFHGYLWQASAWTVVNAAPGTGTVLLGINNKRQLVGFTLAADGTTQGVKGTAHALQPFDVPGATNTVPLDITDKGEVVGVYADEDGTIESFYFDGMAAFYRIRVPLPDVVLTGVESLSNTGGLTGRYARAGVIPEDLLSYGMLLHRFVDSAAATLILPGGPTLALVSQTATRQAAAAPTDSLLCPDASQAYQVPLKLQQVAAAVCPKR